MKLGLAVLAVIVAFGASSAEAGLFGGGKKKFPKAIDSPVVRSKVKESHKAGARMKHLQSSDTALVSSVERA